MKFKIIGVVISTFLGLIILSFICDLPSIRYFLGDTICSGNLIKDVCDEGYHHTTFRHGQSWHWGYRHWLVYVMGISSAVINLYYLIFKTTPSVK